MKIINFSQGKLKFGVLMAISLNTSSCQVAPSANSAPLTRQQCESDGSWVFIPSGKFIQGSDRTERDYAYRISAQAIGKTAAEVKSVEQKLRQTGWFNGESDRQTTSLDSYCISRNLVTNQEYQEFIQATNYPAPGITEAEYQQQGFLVHSFSQVQKFLWHQGTYPQNKARHPVVLISYHDALAYGDWKGKQTGDTYRSPTAAEWEKAARGTAGNYFPWGNDWRPDGTNSASSGLNYTSEIATFPLSKSSYGVEDMAGNVFEYTSTLSEQGSFVVMKGCSWDDLPGFCRGAYRHLRPVNSRHILFGFRLVKEK
jgi:toxoflavin biosynthesis protein ToxD